MYDDSTRGYGPGAGINFHRDFWYPALSKHFEVVFFDPDVTYHTGTTFLHDAYHEPSRHSIPRQLEQGYRVVLHSPTERKINPAPFEAALAWAMMYPTQIFWLLSGNDLRHWSDIRYSEIPFWFWLLEQYSDQYRDYQPQRCLDRRFLCLMNNPHVHRQYLWQQLEKRHMLNQGVVSFRAHGVLIEDEPPSPIDIWLDRVVNPAWFDRTAVSVVSETDVQGDERRHAWLTEKTTKCLMMQHPFLIQGQRGSLDILHRFGFETFPELWDESYDHNVNWIDRTNTILDIVNNLHIDSVLEPRIQQKLRHNCERFWDRRATADMFDQSVIFPLMEWMHEQT